MSYQIGWDALNLKPAERIAHTEYLSNRNLIKAVTGEDSDGPTSRFREAWKFDFAWSTHDGPVEWSKRGRTTDMGHGDFLEGGTDRREAKPCLFHSVEEVLEFDAVREYGLPDFHELVAFYENYYQENQKAMPELVMPGGYYKTIVSGGIETFGWDMFLMGAADPDRFEAVLDSFFRLSLHHFKAWAETSIKAFICHDDMVWSQGAFMHPDFYRRVIFPRYRRLWAVLKEQGIKVLFCSDANWTEFIDDIAEAGADGFIFEPMTSLEAIVERYGRSHVIVSSTVDCRTLTLGTKDRIRAEVDASLELAHRCPGFIFAVGNHIPSNVPVENALFYFDHLRKNWRR